MRLMPIPEWFLFFFKQFRRSKRSLLVITALTVAASACGAAAPLLIGRLTDAIAMHAGNGLVPLAATLLAALLALELCSQLRGYVSSKTMLRLTYELTEHTLSAVLRTSSSFFARTPRGELLQRLTQDTRMIQQFGLSSLPAFMQELLLACAAIVVIGGWNWLLAVSLAAAYVILFIPVHRFGRKRGQARKELAAHDARIRQSLLEKLETVKQIKLYGTERREYETVAAEQSRWGDLKFQENVADSLYRTFPRIPDSLAPALVFLFAGWQTVSGDATVGQLVTIIAYIPALNAPVRSFFGLYVNFADIRVRIQGIMDYARLPAEPGLRDGLRELPRGRGLPISFHNVRVAGDRGDLLRRVTFTVAPGEHVAIVGPSGAGKSTLLQLIVRLREPSEGEIAIGGVPLRELDATRLRSRVGYVMQEGALFGGSLERNLTYLAEADRRTLDRWMEAFGAADIVSMLPEGYDSDIGAAGGRLSGGQRQLVSLTQTMVKRPDLLLLDEATSSLDQKAETAVYEALRLYASDITRISVTHRLRGAALADRILVLDRGELVEQGTHEQLLRRQGLYAELWRREREQDSAFGGDAIEFDPEGGPAHERQHAGAVR
ncbi:ABC transporter ATP-binding protein [Paenibacillus sp. GYB003]|uniref:ABC transporter ATP-binding protein n=1 Tax=Paenibacillus sp. GYB003 TaxID=2994392 RepID=UPI002F960C74